MTQQDPAFLQPQAPSPGTSTPPTTIPATSNQTVPVDDRPHREPADTEEVYFQGSPLMRSMGVEVVVWMLGGLVLIAIPILASLTGHKMPLLFWAIFVLLGLALLFVPMVMMKSIRYRITNYRIDREHGIFSRDIDTLELWHVEDLHFHQSLIGRIFNVGSIHVLSHDRTMPDLMIRGIPHPRPLYETLKQRVIAVKRSQGVLKVDPG